MIALVLAALAGALALAGSASAATGHKFLSELNEAPPGTALTSAEAVAISPATGEVFVAAGEEGVDVFDSAGKFKTQFGVGILEGETPGIAVDGSGRVYVADLSTNSVYVFKPSGGGYTLLATWTGAGTPGKAFGELRGIAVDDSASASKGEVYVSENGGSGVNVFEPQPESSAEPGFIKSLSGKPELEELGGVAVDPNTGQVFVADTKAGETGFVEVFSAAHVFESKLSGKGAPTSGLGPLGAIALEPSTGDVYVADTEVGALDQLNSAGEWIGWVRAAPNGKDLNPAGVAVSGSGRLYVAASSVEIFGPNVVVPDVKTGTGKSSKSKPVVVTLTGTINPLGKATKYHFEYGTPGEFTNSTKVEEIPGSGEAKVTAQVEGLKPGTAYDFRLVAESEEKLPNYGQTVEFITAEAVAGVETLPATNIEPTGATLHGSLEPQKFPTKYYFEWGENTQYGHNSPVPFGETNAGTAVPVETKLTGLKPGVTYHYRLVASNQFGISYGGDAQFTTSGPAITPLPATSVSPTEETLSAKIDPNKLKTKVHFEYGETTGYGKSTEPEPVESPKTVEAKLKELKLATTYHFRVVVEVEGGGTSVGPDQEFTTALIESESATELSAESARVQAELNPGKTNKAVSCQFEYGTTSAYGATIPCEPASSKTAAVFSALLKGLAASTTYHYRVTVTVEGIAEKGVGPDRTFTTLASGTSFKLPDGRAYEMVSPPDKKGGYIEPINLSGGAIQASEDGNAFAYIVNGPIREVEGNRTPEGQQVLATRSPSSWTSQEIVPPHESPAGLRVGNPNEYLAFSGNLALAAVQPFPFGLTPYAEPPLAPPASEAERKPCPASTSERPCQEKTMYLRSDAPLPPSPGQETVYEEAKHAGETLGAERGEAAQPGFLPLVTDANVAPGAAFGGTQLKHGQVKPSLEFLTATPDLTHVLFKSAVALAPQAPSAPGLYEWAANQLQLVSVLPGGEAAAGKVALGYSFDVYSGAILRHAVSVDGGRVFWTTPEDQEERGHLYLRDIAGHQTLQLDVPAQGLPVQRGEAAFQGASSDGSRAFFTDPQRLTADSTAGAGKSDLYECEIGETAGKLACTGGLKDLTVDHNAGETAGVKGVVSGISEDGSYVYLVATGNLASPAHAGPPNLYELHFDGTSWTTTLVAQLSTEDAPDWSSRGVGGETGNRKLVTDLTARVSPNGEYFTFMSNQRLTGYNNTDLYEEAGKHADEEVFLYSAAAHALTCPSCNPTGARPRGVFDTEIAGEGGGLVVDRPHTWMAESGSKEIAHWLAGSIPGWTPLTQNRAIYQSRFLSNSGRLFFNSADALVPEAAGDVRTETIEGKAVNVGVENVYEFQPNHVGSCGATAGCVSLVSSATSGKESSFLDASPAGNDVFFLTAAKLVPQDEDGSYDVYDARVCGESGCQAPAEPAATPCESIPACRGGGSGPPTFIPAPTFSGPGNTPHQVPNGETLPVKVTKRPLTNAQKLALALKSCRKMAHRTKAQKSKRKKCESAAKKKYGAKKAKRSASGQSKGRGR